MSAKRSNRPASAEPSLKRMRQTELSKGVNKSNDDVILDEVLLGGIKKQMAIIRAVGFDAVSRRFRSAGKGKKGNVRLQLDVKHGFDGQYHFFWEWQLSIIQEKRRSGGDVKANVAPIVVATANLNSQTKRVQRQLTAVFTRISTWRALNVLFGDSPISAARSVNDVQKLCRILLHLNKCLDGALVHCPPVRFSKLNIRLTHPSPTLIPIVGNCPLLVQRPNDVRQLHIMLYAPYGNGETAADISRSVCEGLFRLRQLTSVNIHLQSADPSVIAAASVLLRQQLELRQFRLYPLESDDDDAKYSAWLHETCKNRTSLRTLRLPLLAPWASPDATPANARLEPSLAAIIGRLHSVTVPIDSEMYYLDKSADGWKAEHFMATILRHLPVHGTLRLYHDVGYPRTRNDFERAYFRMLLRQSIAAARTIKLTMTRTRKRAGNVDDFVSDSVTIGEFPDLKVTFRSHQVTVVRCGSGTLRFLSQN